MKLLLLSQPNCSPCSSVKNYLESNEVKYNSINVQESPEVAGQYGVMSTPVTILLDENSEEVDRCVGFNPAKLDELISKL